MWVSNRNRPETNGLEWFRLGLVSHDIFIGPKQASNDACGRLLVSVKSKNSPRDGDPSMIYHSGELVPVQPQMEGLHNKLTSKRTNVSLSLY